jgi:hypothetical protein
MSARISCLKVMQILAAVLFMLAGFMTAMSTSYAQTGNWSQPVLLSDPRGPSGWFPDIFADAAGRIHVVWSSTVGMGNNNSTPGHDVVMYTTSQDGQVWSKPLDITAIAQERGSEATRPTVLVDGQGIFHLDYRYTDVFYVQAPAESVASQVPRLSPRRVSTAGIAYFSRLALDRHGRLHLILTQMVSDPTNTACPACYHVFHRRSDDNGLTWSSPTDISVLGTGSAKPQVVIDSKDNIYVVWEAGAGGSYGHVVDPVKVMYTASYDRGETWATPVEFVAPNGAAKDISIGLDGEDKLVVAWLGLPEHLVYYQFSRDQARSWSPPQPIPGIWGASLSYESVHDDFAMATDGAGKVHLVLVGRTTADQKTTSLLHLIWDGAAWSEPEAITTLTGDVPEWPRISIGLGNRINVVWFVRDKEHIWDTDHGRYSIWYAQGIAQAPALAPVTWPTPTPKVAVAETSTPTPTAAPTPTPTLAADLERAPIPAGTTEVIFTESDDLLLLVKSLAPAALLIAAVVIVVHLRRR